MIALALILATAAAAPGPTAPHATMACGVSTADSGTAALEVDREAVIRPSSSTNDIVWTTGLAWGLRTAPPDWPVSAMAKRVRLCSPRLENAKGAGWLTVRIYYRWTSNGDAGRHLALWVNGYAAAYPDSRNAAPGSSSFVHSVSVPADVIARHNGRIDMLLNAQIESRDGSLATLIVDRIDVVCTFAACRTPQ